MIMSNAVTANLLTFLKESFLCSSCIDCSFNGVVNFKIVLQFFICLIGKEDFSN